MFYQGKIIHKIIPVLTHYFPKSTIYLFGSRGRGDHTSSSDFDLLLITNLNCSNKARILIKTGLQHLLQTTLKIKVHILLETPTQVVFKSKIKGNIVRWAFYEGSIIFNTLNTPPYYPQQKN